MSQESFQTALVDSLRDISALKAKVVMLTDALAEEKRRRIAEEATNRTITRQTTIIVDHLDRLIKFVRMESLSKVKAIESERGQRKKAVEAAAELKKAEKKVALQHRTISELKETSRMLIQQLRMMDEKFVRLQAEVSASRLKHMQVSAELQRQHQLQFAKELLSRERHASSMKRSPSPTATIMTPPLMLMQGQGQRLNQGTESTAVARLRPRSAPTGSRRRNNQGGGSGFGTNRDTNKHPPWTPPATGSRLQQQLQSAGQNIPQISHGNRDNGEESCSEETLHALKLYGIPDALTDALADDFDEAKSTGISHTRSSNSNRETKFGNRLPKSREAQIRDRYFQQLLNSDTDEDNQNRESRSKLTEAERMEYLMARIAKKEELKTQAHHTWTKSDLQDLIQGSSRP